jgi:hypothetical protein
MVRRRAVPIDRAPVRLIQNVVKPKDLAPIASQQFDETKPMRERGSWSWSTAI